MGNTRTSLPVAEALRYINILPPVVNTPDNPYPTLVKVRRFIGILVATILGYWFLKATVTTHPTRNRLWRERSARQALVETPPLGPPVALAEDARIALNQFQRYLFFFISACCSSIIVVWLANLSGATNLPPVVEPPVDLFRVLGSAGHLSRNVAAASSGVCYLKTGLELVDLVC
ncbi:unnamed protein product [Rhizoctonia solani]|uniref:Uncharacterized protein n=1 Tax=Rhizoctonia solani TaxID=456999 RepID=A0A8H2WI18_9AGAM|nr:unnamed protein product [Rhizoctonia solani]